MAEDVHALRALLSARVPPAIAELRAYAPDASVVPVRLDANEAPPLLPTLTPDERAVFRAALDAIEPARYPDVRAGALRAALCTRLGVEPSQLVIGCGSDEVIAMLLATLGQPIGGEPACVVVPSPSFVMYRISARVHGLEVVEVPLDARCDLDEGAMLDAMRRRRPAVVFLATPNNPTSRAYDLGKVERLVEAAAKLDPPTVVVIDEAYLPFRLGGDDPWGGTTGLDLLRTAPHMVVLRTLSKIGLAGLRVGWAIAHPLLAEQLEKVRLPYDVPSLSQAGALAALGPLSIAIDRHVARIVAERARLVGSLARIAGVSHPRADANFVWLSLPEGRAAFDVAAALKADGVLVRAFPAHAGKLRVTVGSEHHDDRFLSSLQAALLP